MRQQRDSRALFSFIISLSRLAFPSVRPSAPPSSLPPPPLPSLSLSFCRYTWRLVSCASNTRSLCIARHANSPPPRTAEPPPSIFLSVSVARGIPSILRRRTNRARPRGKQKLCREILANVASACLTRKHRDIPSMPDYFHTTTRLAVVSTYRIYSVYLRRLFCSFRRIDGSVDSIITKAGIPLDSENHGMHRRSSETRFF